MPGDNPKKKKNLIEEIVPLIRRHSGQPAGIRTDKNETNQMIMNTKRADDGDAEQPGVVGVRRIVTRYSSWPERRGAQGGRVGGRRWPPTGALLVAVLRRWSNRNQVAARDISHHNQNGVDWVGLDERSTFSSSARRAH